MKIYTHLLLYLLVLLFSCKVPIVPTSYKVATTKVISSETDTVSSITKYLKPFKDSLDKKMNEVICYANTDFRKEKPAGSLGNLVADALLEKAKTLNPTCAGAICNYGGIRIPEIKKGNITTGKIFELLPFENELVILEINGETLQNWLQLIAESGGWPIQFNKILHFKKNISDQNNQKENYSTPTFQINKDEIYYIATIDYIANGGDKCFFLKESKRINTGLLLRNIMIKYLIDKKNITADNEKRIQFIK